MSLSDIAQLPEVAAGSTTTCRRDLHRFQASFRWAGQLRRWRLDFKQSNFRHITRVLRLLASYALAREPVNGMLLSPYSFEAR